MRHIETFSYLKNEFELGKISREDYWAGVKLFLLEISLFSQTQKNHSLEMEIKKGELFIKIQISKSSKSNVLMALIPEDVRSVPFTAVAHGFYEPFQADILVEIGNRSETFVDIGANMGFYSLALCEENRKLYAHSFEPNPNVFSTLNYNIELNKFGSRITTYNFGLANTNEKLILFEPQLTGSGGASFRELHSEEGPHLKFSAQVKKLDELNLQNLDLIKIDVEGCEYNVLMGSIKTILSSKPTICAELLRKWMKEFGHQPQNFVDTLLKLDYQCFSISKNYIHRIKEINERTVETNFIFCHNSKVNHMKYLRGLIA